MTNRSLLPRHTTTGGKQKQNPHYHGHRERLRQRFLDGNPDALPDYELLELLLFYAIPRRDVKILSKSLIKHFGSFAGVLAASPERLMELDGVKQTTAGLIKAVQISGLRLARAEVIDQVVLSSWDKLIDYCRAGLAQEKTERFQVLYLNSKNALMADEVHQQGTVDHTPVYPREIIKRALELGATALIMVHNHPSGDATPSRADIDMTREVRDAATKLSIILHDHLIVTRSGYSSFKEMGLL